MKVESVLFGLLVAFTWVVGFIYGHFTHWHEPVGAVALFLTGGLAAMIAGYFFITGRKLDLRPDDNPEGDIADVEGEYGFFSPHSWWPLFLAAAAATMFLGMAIGWWLVIIAVPFVCFAVVGWVFEYFRGENAV